MAATNIYLKLDGVDGESMDTDHQDWIELEAWNWGVSNPSSFAHGQGGQATQAHVQDITVVKRMDKSSATLMKNCTTGKHIQSGIISCMKLDGDSRVEYLKIDLKDIMVSGVSFAANGQEHEVHENVQLCFAEFKTAYKLQQDAGSAGGSTEFGYNIQTSQPS